jgi:hypothetical protein
MPAFNLRHSLHQLLTLLVLACTLAGCALHRVIDSEVQSFAGPAVPAKGTLYQFERLPSQTGMAQEQIEAMAAQVLARAGLVRAAASEPATLTVQVSAQVSPLPNPHASRPGILFMGERHQPGVRYPSLWLNADASWYRHAVQVVMRDTATARVVYETRASFDGPWSDSQLLLPVVFDAALQGYPNPPAGPRKVVSELPATPVQQP